MAIIVADNFTDVAGTDLTAHTADSGATYARHPAYSGNSAVISDANRARPVTASAQILHVASVAPTGAEYDVSGVVVKLSDSGHGGVAGRCHATDATFYGAVADDSGLWRLYKAEAGSFTSLGTYSQSLTLGTGYTVKLELRNAAKKVYVDGVERISSADNAITAAGKFGPWFYSGGGSNVTAFHLDSLTAEETATGTQYTRTVPADAALSPRVALYLTSTASDLNPGAEDERKADVARGSGVAGSDATATVTGATSGVQVKLGGVNATWLSPPLKATVISGTVSFNLWGLESATQANTGLDVLVERVNSAGAVQSTIVRSERGTELATSAGVNAWTASATATTLADGDRIKVTVFGNDAGGTMASGRTFTLRYNGASAGADGDSYVAFAVGLLQLYTRTVPATAATSATGTRTVGATASLEIPASTRTVPATAALSATLARTVGATAATSATNARTVGATAALSLAGLARTVAASVALAATASRTVPATAALSGTVARTVPATAALSLAGLGRTVPATAALSLAGLNRTVPATAATSLVGARTVAASAALSATAQRTVPATAALSLVNARTVPVSAATSLALARTVGATAALSAALSRTVAATASLSAEATLARTVPASAALAATFARTVTTGAALAAAGIRTAPASAALSLAGLARTVPASAATSIRLARTVPASVATSLASARTVVASGAMSATGLRVVPCAAALAARATRTAGATAALAALIARGVPASAALDAIPAVPVAGRGTWQGNTPGGTWHDDTPTGTWRGGTRGRWIP